jgi:hypothetical protein
MPTEVEWRTMNEQQALAAIRTMTLAELRDVQRWPQNAGVMRAVSDEVHWREAVDARAATDRRDSRRFWVVATIAGATLIVSALTLLVGLATH